MEHYASLHLHSLPLPRLRVYGRLCRIYAAGTPPLYLWAGAFANGSPSLPVLLLLFIMGVLVGMGYMVLNDYFDMEVDRLSSAVATERPLANGEISPVVGAVFGFSCVLLIAVLGFLFLEGLAVAVLIVALLLGLVYDAFNKTYPGLDLLGCLSVPAAVLVGALAVSGSISSLVWMVAALFGIRTVFQNVVAGGMKDLEGDKAQGVRTTAMWLTGDSKEVSVSMRLLAYGLEGSFIAICLFIVLQGSLGVLALLVFLLFLPPFLLTLRRMIPRPYNREDVKRFGYPHEMLSILFILALLSFSGWTPLPILLFSVPVVWFLVGNMALYGQWKPSV